ncbi:MAG: sugar isomerase domain-containing protein, partial [Chitinophagaceae bacterium]|nr:sugar isomerase domain-containing protein [Chitinophagaceae bacterium]
GLAERILRNFGLDKKDSALIISSSGCNIVPVEMAELFQQRGIKVVAIITEAHSAASSSKRKDGKKLGDFADLIIDTGAPAGDSMIQVEGLDTPVSPGSTVGGVMIVNGIKAELAGLLTKAGHPPQVLTAACVAGAEKATALFEAAYDEHAHRLAELYRNAGK